MTIYNAMYFLLFVLGVSLIAAFAIFLLAVGESIERKEWRRCAHEGKEHRVGQDVYRVEYVRSEPKEWK